MFFRKAKFGTPNGVEDDLKQLDSEIEKFEALIESAPQKLREQRERERTMIPAPDDFADRRRERRFYASLSKGEMKNERRYQTRNTILFVLLACATASICWWIYMELIRNGVIQ